MFNEHVFPYKLQCVCCPGLKTSSTINCTVVCVLSSKMIQIILVCCPEVKTDTNCNGFVVVSSNMIQIVMFLFVPGSKMLHVVMVCLSPAPKCYKLQWISVRLKNETNCIGFLSPGQFAVGGHFASVSFVRPVLSSMKEDLTNCAILP